MTIESQDGSHFFVKTPGDSILRVSLIKADEEYENDYLEENINNLVIIYGNDLKIKHSEKVHFIQTISKFIIDFLSKNHAILKIEVKTNCGKDQQIAKFIASKPKNISAFVKEFSGASFYFIFDQTQINTSEFLSNLIKEYEDE